MDWHIDKKTFQQDYIHNLILKEIEGVQGRQRLSEEKIIGLESYAKDFNQVLEALLMIFKEDLDKWKKWCWFENSIRI